MSDPTAPMAQASTDERAQLDFPTSSTSVIDASKMYTALGLDPVVLHGRADDGGCKCHKGAGCRSAAKHPRFSAWQTRTTTADEFEEGDNIGLRMGGQHRVVALDIDGPEGRASLAQMEAAHSPLPRTTTSKSGRVDGGEHRLYCVPANLDIAALANRVSMMPGLDIRAEGGQIVVAPSRHKTGNQYAWTDTIDAADMPQWLYDVIVATPRKSRLPASTSAPAPQTPQVAAVVDDVRARLRTHFREADLQAMAARMADGKALATSGRHGAILLATQLLSRVAKPEESDESVFAVMDASLAAMEPDRPDVLAEAWDAFTRVRPKHAEQRMHEASAREMLRTALGIGKHHHQASDCPSTAPTAATTPTPRPVIKIRPEEHEVIREAIAALAPHEAVHQRGGALVRIARNARPDGGVRRPDDSPYISALPSASLRELMTETADWLGWDKSDEEWVPGHPPLWAVAGVYAKGTWHGVRALEAIAEAPVLRSDGTVLSTIGYDASTGIYLAPTALIPALVDAPTHDDAIRARDLLLDIVADFPFAAEAHKSAWLAALLTPLARVAMDGEPAPMTLIDANTRGSGKSRLCDVISLIVSGRSMPRMPYATDDDETRKRITTITLAGDLLVLLDNIGATLGCPSLDAALTASTWHDRRLGANEAVRLPLVTTFFATGNNVSLVGDTARRTNYSRLESPLERPEEREGFRHADLLSHVRRERSMLLGAALTILRAYFVAGCPDQHLRQWGSYEAWTRIVRGALVWAGLPDPAETRAVLIETADVRRTALTGLLAGIELLGPAGAGVTAADIVRAVEYHRREYPGLDAAVRELCRTAGDRSPDARGVGYALRSVRGQILAGRVLERGSETHDGVARWVVRRVGGASAGDAGDAGHPPAPAEKNFAQVPGERGPEHPPHGLHHPQPPLCAATPTPAPLSRLERLARMARAKPLRPRE